LRKSETIEKNVKLNLQKILFHLLSHPGSKKLPAELMFDRNLNSKLNLICPKTELKVKNNKINLLNIKQFKERERVAVREYLDKNIKWIRNCD